MKKDVTIAFIGHRDFEVAKNKYYALYVAVTDFILCGGIKHFLFGSKSKFNDFCYLCVTECAEVMNGIVREYIRADYEFPSESYSKFLRERFEKTEYPPELHTSRKNRYIKRNEIMIDRCDILVTYFDESYVSSRGRRSGTALAVAYAKKKNKEIINLFDYE